MVVKLDSKHRLTLPKSLTPAKPGDSFEVSYDTEENTVIFRRLSKDKRNWFEVLKSCPVRLVGDLPPRSREYFKPKI